MRIRRCAARLLGTVCAVSFSSPASLPPPSQQPWTADDAVSSDGCGILCELNRSPWDDLMCLDLVAAFDQDEEEENGEGIMGNAAKAKAEAGEDTGVPGNHLKNEADSTATVEREEARKEPMMMMKKKKQKKKRKKKKQKKQNAVAVVEEEETTGASCKKSDGRGWHCKRRAQHPHSLCSYHLAQLRSYNASKVEVSKESHAGRKKQQADGSGDDSDFYYYYSGFGPWRGKTRSSGSRSDIGVRRFALGDEEDDDNDEDNGIVYEVAAATIAGGGEEEGSDLDNGGGGGGGGGNRGDNASRNASNRGNYKSYKKRGRKRMKARSLKSLL